MPGEFDIIREYFQRGARADGLVLGIGDDGAVLSPRAGFDQVVVTDTIVEGRHFPRMFSAADIGWRALAVNLSDIAAMGATARFAFLNLTLPDAHPDWLREFANGFFELAGMTSTALAGGDTTQGPLSVTVTVIGEVPEGRALLRAGAKPGDLVCVSGAPGEAAAGLELLQQGEAANHPLVERFRRPVPRLALGEFLRDRASAVVDVSDGLAADLGHILAASNVGARIDIEALPVSTDLSVHARNAHDYVLAGGDDYELCFCLPREHLDDVIAHAECRISVIGEITAAPGIDVVHGNGKTWTPTRRGYEHFRKEDG